MDVYQVVFDVSHLMDDFRAAVSSEDKVYTADSVRYEIEQITAVAVEHSRDSFFSYMKAFRHDSKRVRERLSYLYVCMKDELTELLPDMDRIRVIALYTHRFDDTITLTYNYLSHEVDFNRWLRARDELYPTHPEVTRLLDEYARATPPVSRLRIDS